MEETSSSSLPSTSLCCPPKFPLRMNPRIALLQWWYIPQAGKRLQTRLRSSIRLAERSLSNFSSLSCKNARPSPHVERIARESSSSVSGDLLSSLRKVYFSIRRRRRPSRGFFPRCCCFVTGSYSGLHCMAEIRPSTSSSPSSSSSSGRNEEEDRVATAGRKGLIPCS